MKFTVFILSITLSLLGSFLYADDFQDFLDQELIEVEDRIKFHLNEIENGLDIQQHYFMMGQETELKYIMSQYKYLVKNKEIN